jgi:hypothetical protein
MMYAIVVYFIFVLHFIVQTYHILQLMEILGCTTFGTSAERMLQHCRVLQSSVVNSL